MGTSMGGRLSGIRGVNAMCSQTSHAPLPTERTSCRRGHHLLLLRASWELFQVTQAKWIGNFWKQRQPPPCVHPSRSPCHGVRSRATAALWGCPLPPAAEGTSVRPCQKPTLPHIATQILPNYNGISSAAKYLRGCFSSYISFSAHSSLHAPNSRALLSSTEQSSFFFVLPPFYWI